MATKPTLSAPASKIQCIEGCKHTGQGDVTVTQLRCLSCSEWYHIDCVGLPEEESNGSFTCPPCRQLPRKVESTLSAVDASNNNFSNLNDELLSLKDCIDDLESMFERCVSKITSLESKVNQRSSDEMVQEIDQIIDQKNAEIEYLKSKKNDLEKAVQNANDEKLLLQLAIKQKDAEIATLKNSSTSNKDGNTTYRDALLGQLINQPLGRAVSVQPGGSGYAHGTSLNPDAGSFIPRNSPIPANTSNIPETSIASLGSQPDRLTVVRANYFSLDVSEDMVKAHVASVLDYHEVRVELIQPPSHIVKPTYKCFKITAPGVYDQQLLNPETWPEGISFRRYYPKRGRTQRQQQQK